MIVEAGKVELIFYAVYPHFWVSSLLMILGTHLFVY